MRWLAPRTSADERARRAITLDRDGAQWGPRSPGVGRLRLPVPPGGPSVVPSIGAELGHPTGASIAAMGAAVEAHTWIVDGVDITDPVVGTPALKVSPFGGFGAEVATASPAIERATAGGLVLVESTFPGDDVEGQIAASGIAGPTAPRLASAAISGEVGGPVIRDRLWLRGGVAHDAAAGPRRSFAGTDGRLDLRAWHGGVLANAALLGQRATVTVDGTPKERAVLAGGIDAISWAASGASVEAGASALRAVIDGEVRARDAVGVAARLDRVDGHGRLPHRALAGAQLERISWGAPSASTRAWLGAEASAGTLSRGSLYASAQLGGPGALRVDLATRADLALGRVHLGPRAAVAYWPTEKTSPLRTVALSVGRRHGALTMPLAFADPARGLPRVDEAELSAHVTTLRRLILSGSA